MKEYYDRHAARQRTPFPHRGVCVDLLDQPARVAFRLPRGGSEPAPATDGRRAGSTPARSQTPQPAATGGIDCMSTRPIATAPRRGASRFAQPLVARRLNTETAPRGSNISDGRGPTGPEGPRRYQVTVQEAEVVVSRINAFARVIAEAGIKVGDRITVSRKTGACVEGQVVAIVCGVIVLGPPE